MRIYKYKFCDGTESEVEVSDMEFKLLKKIDEREQRDNRQYKRRCVSLGLLTADTDGEDGGL